MGDAQISVACSTLVKQDIHVKCIEVEHQLKTAFRHLLAMSKFIKYLGEGNVQFDLDQ